MDWKTTLTVLAVASLIIALPFVASLKVNYLFFDDFNYRSWEEMEEAGWILYRSHIEFDTGEIQLFNYAQIIKEFKGIDAKTVEYRWKGATYAGSTGTVSLQLHISVGEGQDCYYSIGEGKTGYGEEMQIYAYGNACTVETFTRKSITGDLYHENYRIYKVDLVKGVVWRNDVPMFSDYKFEEGVLKSVGFYGATETISPWLDYVLIK